MPKEEESHVIGTSQHADLVEITYFTDPLCCWSYALEPSWQRLLCEQGDHIRYRYVMCGLLPDWNTYNDSVNAVSRPAQMGPVWMQASHISGVPIRSELWITDPPVSSYPACIAVKCAELQSFAAGEAYLSLIRTRAMTEAQNISKQEVLEKTAYDLAETNASFDAERFCNDLVNGTGLEAFRKDWQTAQLQHISRYPTLIFRRKGYQALMLPGYQSYDVLLRTLRQLLPHNVPA